MGINVSNNVDNLCQEVLDFIGLKNKNQPTVTLSLFDKKRLMIASALVMKPKMLLLDEPMGGLNPSEIEGLIKLVKKINKIGITIILIEHIMQALMNLSDRMMILNYGRKISEGVPVDVAKDKNVIKTYLGETLGADVLE
jgi:ABC-type branched-subunit amino acid transport system ATPase component